MTIIHAAIAGAAIAYLAVLLGTWFYVWWVWMGGGADDLPRRRDQIALTLAAWVPPVAIAGLLTLGIGMNFVGLR